MLVCEDGMRVYKLLQNNKEGKEKNESKKETEKIDCHACVCGIGAWKYYGDPSCE